MTGVNCDLPPRCNIMVDIRYVLAIIDRSAGAGPFHQRNETGSSAEKIIEFEGCVAAKNLENWGF
jgi:hypothetical protein